MARQARAGDRARSYLRRAAVSNQPIHVLLNPASGGGRARRRWERIAALARDRLRPLTLHASARRGELEAVARSLREQDVIVVAAGGDGTSHEVVNGLLARHAAPPRATLAWLPIGSGNDLARSAGVPRRPADAVALIAGRASRPIDVGELRFRGPDGEAERVFGNSLTIGLSGRVLELVARRRGLVRGDAAYGMAAVRALIGGRPLPLRVEADGAPVFAGPSWLVSVTSGAYFGAGMLAAPGARVDDGRLHLATIAGISRLRALALFPRIYSGRHVRHPAVSLREVATARVEAAEDLAVEIDGELLRASSSLAIVVRPRALAAIAGPAL